MVFDINFRNNLQIQLRKNKTFFENESLKIIDNYAHSFYRVMLDNLSSEYTPFKFDIQSLKKCINDTISKEETPCLQLKLGNGREFRNNEIQFNLVKSAPPVWGSEKQKQYRIDRENLEYICEGEFWSIKENISDYGKISNFNCFSNIVINIDKLGKEMYKDFNINVDGWIKYLLDLISRFFPEYELNSNFSNTIYRFLKPINNDLFFGFEFDLNNLVGQLKKRELGMPDYFNLILVSKDLKKPTKLIDYYYKNHSDILSLGILGNPFFYMPCFPLLSYKIVEMHHDINNPDNWETNYSTTTIPISENQIEIVYPENYGDNLKKHAFFYMHLLQNSSDLYVSYIIKSLFQIL